MRRTIGSGLVAAVLLVVTVSGDQAAQAAPERIDYLTFAQGAVPLRVVTGTPQGVTMEKAIRAVDGASSAFGLSLKTLPADGIVEFLYVLPALTTFDRFAVPAIVETPSPSTTFTRRVEVEGSAEGPDAGFQMLAAGDLKSGAAVVELPIAASPKVRWVKLRLIGGLQVLRDAMFFEFSEIIGNGTQESAPAATHFNGTWQGRGVRIALRQEGAVVSGCYDEAGVLNGTVTQNILRATGVDQSDGVKSQFVLLVGEDGAMRGLRSSNGAPFAEYSGATAAEGLVKCPTPPPPTLGCGAIIHGITFGFDSAEILPASESVLAMLHRGLRDDPSASIVIEGHTSSEGTDAYNQGLSERRARAVVADLTSRGIPAGRLTAVGIGETRPIATNNDETGRAMNRRVEVVCR